MTQPKPMPQQIQVNLDESVAEGTYANFAIISHSPSEIVVDFVRMMPGLQKAKVQSRIILTPQNAKALSKALEQNLEKFEENFGEIKMFQKDGGKNFGFQTPAGG